MLHVLSMDHLKVADAVLVALPLPLFRTKVVSRARLAIWMEAYHRDVEAELTRRGFGRAPVLDQAG